MSILVCDDSSVILDIEGEGDDKLSVWEEGEDVVDDVCGSLSLSSSGATGAEPSFFT